MIILNKAMLAGLARGKKLFEGVRNDTDDNRLTEDPQGFRGMVGLDNAEDKKLVLEEISKVEKQVGALRLLPPSKENDAELKTLETTLAGLRKELTNELYTCPKCHTEMTTSPGKEITKCSKCGAPVYPHDVFANKKDGLKRGGSKYGAIKNEGGT